MWGGGRGHDNRHVPSGLKGAYGLEGMCMPIKYFMTVQRVALAHAANGWISLIRVRKLFASVEEEATLAKFSQRQLAAATHTSP